MTKYELHLAQDTKITELEAEIAKLKKQSVVWHKTTEGDLPDTDRLVYVQTKRGDTGKAYYSNGYWNSSEVSGIVIAWCEEPRFKE